MPLIPSGRMTHAITALQRMPATTLCNAFAGAANAVSGFSRSSHACFLCQPEAIRRQIHHDPHLSTSVVTKDKRAVIAA
jgi:hypothetical protein